MDEAPISKAFSGTDSIELRPLTFQFELPPYGDDEIDTMRSMHRFCDMMLRQRADEAQRQRMWRYVRDRIESDHGIG